MVLNLLNLALSVASCVCSIVFLVSYKRLKRAYQQRSEAQTRLIDAQRRRLDVQDEVIEALDARRRHRGEIVARQNAAN